VTSPHRCGWSTGGCGRWWPASGRTGIDADALATIGIDLEAVRRSVEESFGPGALSGRQGCRRGRRFGHVPLCPRAKRALERSLREALALRQRHIGAEHVLLGLASDPENGAAMALRRCGTSPEAVRAATLAALRDAA
jgi:ATP-dependent Clp protease ATP-binding subunit ClpA